jgi:hypothetical protein
MPLISLSFLDVYGTISVGFYIDYTSSVQIFSSTDIHKKVAKVCFKQKVEGHLGRDPQNYLRIFHQGSLTEWKGSVRLTSEYLPV